MRLSAIASLALSGVLLAMSPEGGVAQGSVAGCVQEPNGGYSKQRKCWDGGKRRGRWVLRYADGTVEEGPVVAGLREGRHAEEAERRERERSPGGQFRDCRQCPEMVVVPSGSYRMGSPSSESGRYDDEGPEHQVTIAHPFAVGVYEVTFGEWDACVNDRGCGGRRPDDEGWGRSRRPVINVSWEDAQAYVRWLSGKTGEAYRLLSEAEWEYVARAGTRTMYWWGDTIGRSRANYNRNHGNTVDVGSYAPNGFGLYDVHGNVWEWVEDCWNGSYSGAPSDGSAWESVECRRRVLRGGSWYSEPRFLRSASRLRVSAGNRDFHAGFRVARTLTP